MELVVQNGVSCIYISLWSSLITFLYIKSIYLTAKIISNLTNKLISNRIRGLILRNCLKVHVFNIYLVRPRRSAKSDTAAICELVIAEIGPAVSTAGSSHFHVSKYEVG